MRSHTRRLIAFHYHNALWCAVSLCSLWPLLLCCCFSLQTGTDSSITDKPRSPSLNELNRDSNDSFSAPKRPATTRNNVLVKSEAHTILSSTPVTDSCALEHSPPKVAFAEQEGFDDLSASFRSLYKSLFGHSVGRGDFIGPDSLLDDTPDPDPLSGSNSSIPLGTSASDFTASYGSKMPKFTSLMESMRGLAESNRWDQLNQSQIQDLIDCFRIGEESDHFGLDANVWAGLSSSFNTFLSRVNHRLPSNTATPSRRMSHYSPASNLRHSPTSSFHSINSSGYSNCSNHSMSPQQPMVGMSPGNRHTPYTIPQTMTETLPVLSFAAGPGSPLPQLHIRSAASDFVNTDPDEEDDFDWSKLL